MIIKFSIDKIEHNRYKMKLFNIDKDFLKFFGGHVWHIDFKDKKIFMEHSCTPCRISKDRFSILIDSSNTKVTRFTDKETLFYINNKCSTTSIFITDINNFKELFINAMYVLVENYKKMKNVN